MNEAFTLNNLLIGPSFYLNAISLPRKEGFDEIVEQEKIIADKFLLLKNDIGNKLFNQLTHAQKIFIVNVSNTINLGDSVDIDTIYNNIEKLEYE